MALDQEETLRDSLDAAFTEADAPELESTEVEISSDDDAPAARARDEAGKFAKVDKVEPAAIPGPADELQPEIAPPVVEGKRAPSSWKKETAAEFNTLPPHVQDEILRREGDFHKGIEGFKQHADFGRKFEQAMTPFNETLQKIGVDGVTAAVELLKIDDILRNAPPAVKHQKLLDIAQQFGIDLNQQFDPRIAEYEQRMHMLQKQNEEILRTNLSRETEQVNTVLSQFAEQPGREHFPQVRLHMAALLESGTAKDLQDAYDQAVYANPTTRALLLEQQQRKVQDDFNAKRAKAAAVSVRGSSPSSGTAPQQHDTLRGSLDAAFATHS